MPLHGLAVRVPGTPPGTGAAYAKHKHPASGYAVAAAAAVVTLAGGTFGSVRIAIGGVAGSPVRATAAQEALVGDAPSPQSFASAASTVAASLGYDLVGDSYASAGYRVHLATVLARRALTAAAASA